MKMKLTLIGLFSAAALLLFGASGPPRTFGVIWDHSLTPQSELSGYELWISTNGMAFAPTFVGYVNQVRFSGMPNGTYLFYVVAVSTNGIPAEPSNIARAVVPYKGDNTRIVQ